MSELSDYLYELRPSASGGTPYSKISNKLYIGNADTAANKSFMKSKRIHAVLNCTKDLPNFFEGDTTLKIEYARIPVNDNARPVDEETMFKYADFIAEFIYRHADIDGHAVLVGCHEGKSRSVTATVLYLIAKHGMTPKQACEYILRKRKEAFFYGRSVNFSNTIEKFYSRVKNK